MTQKDHRTRVTGGPITSLVRPILFLGILAAGVGTAVALSWLWLTAVVPTSFDWWGRAMR